MSNSVFNNTLCWVNGKICPADQAAISVFDHGLLYGDGVFEGIRLYHNQAFMLQAHLARLENSAKAIELQLLYSRTQLQDHISTFLQHWPKATGYLRLVITRGIGSLGIDPKRCEKPSVFMIVSDLQMVDTALLQKGIDVITASTRRMPNDSLDPRIKSLNYLNNILAKQEANRAGAADAILLNHQGKVAEASAANVFIVKNNCLLTPPVNDGALEGITRELVLRFAREMGIEIRVTSLTRLDLVNADECFLTGTGAELIPVARIDQLQLEQCPGPVFNNLLERFRSFTNEPDGWL